MAAIPNILLQLKWHVRRPIFQHGVLAFSGSYLFSEDTTAKRETGNAAQRGNIAAAKAVGSIIKTTLGPRAMLKMILDPMGGIVITNDGNAILREIDVVHPAAKSVIELSRTQDEEVGDGTTSVVILAAELLTSVEPFLEKGMHPRIIVEAALKCLDDSTEFLNSIASQLDLAVRENALNVIRSCLGTKFVSRFGDLMCNMAWDAVCLICKEDIAGTKLIDLKRFARIEKIPGGELSDCRVLDGIILDKDVVHPRMRRSIPNPRIVLLDCPLEFKKGESQTNIKVTKETDWKQILDEEEEQVRRMCVSILAVKPDLVITEKGVSDFAQAVLMKGNVSVLRRVRKMDNDRIARAVGATIVSRPEDIKESHVGTKCGLFKIRKIGDEEFAYMEKCVNPKACSIILRGGSKDVLNELERNLQDALCVGRNLLLESRVLPGGGAAEMALAQHLNEKSKSLSGVVQFPYRALAEALEVIPRTLLQNCGADTIRVLTALRAKHAGGANLTWGVDGTKGILADMSTLQVWDPLTVKLQTIKTAIEATAMLVKIDDVVSGISTKKNAPGGGGQAPAGPMGDDED